MKSRHRKGQCHKCSHDGSYRRPHNPEPRKRPDAENQQGVGDDIHHIPRYIRPHNDGRTAETELYRLQYSSHSGDVYGHGSDSCIIGS